MSVSRLGYALDGRLTAVPAWSTQQTSIAMTSGLVEIANATRAGFLFVNMGTDPIPIDHWLGDFEALHSPWRLDTMKTASHRELRCPVTETVY